MLSIPFCSRLFNLSIAVNEGASHENFMSATFDLDSDPGLFEREKQRFLARSPRPRPSRPPFQLQDRAGRNRRRRCTGSPAPRHRHRGRSGEPRVGAAIRPGCGTRCSAEADRGGERSPPGRAGAGRDRCPVSRRAVARARHKQARPRSCTGPARARGPARAGPAGGHGLRVRQDCSSRATRRVSEAIDFARCCAEAGRRLRPSRLNATSRRRV
ncbi:hypothetical protein HBB16_00455 [Pseudonocardia sp. MCCB 268]|nr:hypothetical protein [Pseudonocardia cytotoxica]